MEGDNINDIIDVGGFSSDLKTVIDGISSLEAKIAEANEKSIIVSVDLKSAENINELTAGIKQQADAIKALTAVQQDNSAVVQQMAQAAQQYGDSAAAVARQINSTGNEVRQLARDLQALQDAQSKATLNGAAYRQFAVEISNLSAKIWELMSAMKQVWGMADSFKSNIGKMGGSVKLPAGLGGAFNVAIGWGSQNGEANAEWSA